MEANAFFNLPVKFAVLLKSSLLFNYFSVVCSVICLETNRHLLMGLQTFNCHR